MMRERRRPDSVTSWRDQPRDDDHARKRFPTRSDFLAHLRATGRPTTKDLRHLRALKDRPVVLPPETDPA